MSDSFNPIPTTINRELIERIEHLNLSITQRHHVRLLVHCMQVFQDISASNNGIFPTDDLLRFWCQAQANRFNDEQFADLLYQQISTAVETLIKYSKKINKNFFDLDIEDLVNVVTEIY